MHDFKIIMNGSGMKSKILMDGANLEGVHEINLNIVAGEPTCLELKIYPKTLEIECANMIEKHYTSKIE